MLRSYTTGCRTMPTNIITEGVPFVKIDKTHEGDKVLGLLKVKGQKFGDSFSLLLMNKDSEYVFMNIPSWLGHSIEEDFNLQSESPEDYFANSHIDEITAIPTNKGNDTWNITFR